MRAFAERLAELGPVESFDYPYQRAGRRLPDRHAVLLAAHREAYESARSRHSGRVVLIGKSMGGRIGCHLANDAEEKPAALVCLGYPLVGQSGAVRDGVLLELNTPVLFVQGTRDALCPLDHLAAVRERMRAPNELFVVEHGDHSLLVTQSALQARGITQADVDRAIVEAIRDFADRVLRR